MSNIRNFRHQLFGRIVAVYPCHRTIDTDGTTLGSGLEDPNDGVFKNSAILLLRPPQCLFPPFSLGEVARNTLYCKRLAAALDEGCLGFYKDVPPIFAAQPVLSRILLSPSGEDLVNRFQRPRELIFC